MTQEERLKQMYSANLASQKETLQQDYEKADADYVQQKEDAQKATDANLTRTAVEAQKEAVNNAEVNNASGLSSGAKAQLRLSGENQMRSDMTALRAQQQENDAKIERARSLLSQEYASAIRKAQQDNDLALAEALYTEAQRREEILREEQERERQNALTAAQLLAETGDYTRLGQIYGLSKEEIAALVAADSAAKSEANAAAQKEAALAAAQLTAGAGDYTRLGQIYGLSSEEIAALESAYVTENGKPTTTQDNPSPENQNNLNQSPSSGLFSTVNNKLASWISSIFGGSGQNGNQNNNAAVVPQNTQNTQNFINDIGTEQDYNATPQNGQYGSYQNYVETKLDEWLQNGKLTENEVAALLVHYGIV